MTPITHPAHQADTIYQDCILSEFGEKSRYPSRISFISNPRLAQRRCPTSQLSSARPISARQLRTDDAMREREFVK